MPNVQLVNNLALGIMLLVGVLGYTTVGVGNPDRMMNYQNFKLSIKKDK